MTSRQDQPSPGAMGVGASIANSIGDLVARAENAYRNSIGRLSQYRFSDLAIFGLILAYAILTRLGGLATEVINWDESTFIVVSSSFAHGHLPYTTTWDIKPPLLFFVLGAMLRTFGETMLTVRATAMICVAVMAFLLYRIARQRWGRTTGIWVGLITVAALSVRDAQAMYTETLSTVFVVAALYFAVRPKGRRGRFYLIGAMVSAAVLTRTNMFPLVASFALWLWLDQGLRRGEKWRAFWQYAIGGLVPLAAIVLVYAGDGTLDDFIFANVTAPLAYATSQASPLLIALAAVLAPFVIAVAYPGSWGVMVFLIFWKSGLANLFKPGLPARTRAALRALAADRYLSAVFLTGLGVYVGVCVNGSATWHHMIQLVPFLVLAAGRALGADPRPRLRVLVLLALVATTLRMLPSDLKVLYYGPLGIENTYPIRKIAAKVRETGQFDGDILALKGQLIYWYLNAAPPNKYGTHPTIFKKSFLIGNGMKEGGARIPGLADTLAKIPQFMICGDNPTERFTGTMKDDITQTLKTHYRQIYQGGGYLLFERNETAVTSASPIPKGG